MHNLFLGLHYFVFGLILTTSQSSVNFFELVYLKHNNINYHKQSIDIYGFDRFDIKFTINDSCLNYCGKYETNLFVGKIKTIPKGIKKIEIINNDYQQTAMIEISELPKYYKENLSKLKYIEKSSDSLIFYSNHLDTLALFKRCNDIKRFEFECLSFIE